MTQSSISGWFGLLVRVGVCAACAVAGLAGVAAAQSGAGPTTCPAAADKAADSRPVQVFSRVLAPADEPRQDVLVTLPPDAGWLGILIAPVPEPLRQHLKLPARQGLIIQNLVVDSPAASLLRQYDIVLQLNGEAVADDNAAFVRKVGEVKAGEAIKLQVLRAGSPMEVSVTLSERPADLARRPLVHDMVDDTLLPAPERIVGPIVRRGPQGGLIMEDLPAELRDFLRELKPGDWDPMPGMDIDIQMDSNAEANADGDGPPDMMTDQQIEATFMRDGKEFTYRQRNKQITIEKTVDGQTTTNTYESKEQLREKDPEAYRMFEGLIESRRTLPLGPGPDAPRIEFRRPGDPGFPDVGAINERMRNAEQRLIDRLERLQGIQPVPNQDTQKQATTQTSDKPSAKASPAAPPPTGTMFDVLANGEIVVELREEGRMLRQRFSDEAALKAASPSLHQKFVETRAQMLGK